MGDTWITDLRHYLGADGQVASELPGPARRHFGAIIASVTSQRSKPRVRCRRRPGRRACPGEIDALLERGEVIRWECPECGDNGFIRGWQGTPWDCRV